MELNNKEKKIKQVLSEVNYQVDTDFLWKEVSKELDGEKKKRRFFWIFPLLGLGILALMFFNNFSIIENSIENNETQTSLSIGTVKSSSTDTKNIEKTPTISDSNTTQAIEAENETILKKTPSTIKQGKNTTSPSFNPTATKPTTPSRLIQKRSSLVAKVNQNNKAQNSTPLSNNTNSEVLLNRNKNSILTSPSLTAALINKEKAGSIPVVGNLKLYQLLAITTLKPQSIPTEARPKKEINTSSFTLIESTNNNARFYLTAGIGSIKNISNEYSDNVEISSAIFERETSLWGVNSTLLFGFETKSKWNIFGGFDYEQLVSRYDDEGVEVIKGETLTTLESIDENYSLIYTEGPLSTTTTIDKDILWHRHHNMLNFQLGVSKDLTPRSAFIIAPEVSLLQNIFSSHKGYYFKDEAPNFVKFERGDVNPYRKNTGLKTQLGLNLGYKTSKWQFAVNTAWRNPLTNLTNELNNYQIKNSQLSIQARVNCLLNWEKN